MAITQNIFKYLGATLTKKFMLDEAARNTLLNESEYSTFDPDDLPSVSAALKVLKTTQDELRVALTNYDASLAAAGLKDVTPGKWTRALSLLVTVPSRGTSSSGAGESGVERPTPNAASMPPAMTTLTSPPPPLFTARSPPPDSVRARGRGRADRVLEEEELTGTRPT